MTNRPRLESPRSPEAGSGGRTAGCAGRRVAGTGDRTLAPKLRLFSRVNDWVGERFFWGDAAGPGISGRAPAPRRKTSRPTPSLTTTPANFPASAQNTWALEVGGLVRQPFGSPVRCSRGCHG